MPLKPPSNPNWVPWAGLFMAVAGIIYQAGGITSSITRLNERTTKLESTDQLRSDAINNIDVRTARIEAKLDYFSPKGQK